MVLGHVFGFIERLGLLGWSGSSTFSLLVFDLFRQGAMMSIAFKEGLKIPPPALNEIILAANHDVRQVGTLAVNTPSNWRLFQIPLLRGMRGS